MLSKKFDLIISLGAACGCALYMKKFKLRDHSYPFDWVYNAPFEKRIELLVNNFKDFLLKENLEKFYKNDGGDLYHDFYKDLSNGFIFLHDFPLNTPLEKSYDEVYEKYQRRISRMYENISASKQVLFIWFQLHETLSDEIVLKAQKELSQKFNKSINLLVFENDRSRTSVQDVKLNDSVLKVVGPFNIDDDYVWGNEKLCGSVFARINGKKKYGYVLLRCIMRLACCFVPSSAMRRKMREKYENKW